MGGQRVAAKVVVEAGAAPAPQASDLRDVAQGVAVGAKMGNEALELVQGERPGATPLTDDRKERVFATKTGHALNVSSEGE